MFFFCPTTRGIGWVCIAPPIPTLLDLVLVHAFYVWILPMTFYQAVLLCTCNVSWYTPPTNNHVAIDVSCTLSIARLCWLCTMVVDRH